MAPRRPSAALVLGVLSGCLAAVAVLPTAIPLRWRLGEAESTVAEGHVTRAVELAEVIQQFEVSTLPGTTQRLGVDFLRVREQGLVTYQEGVPGAPLFACETGNRVAWTSDADGRAWAYRCSVHDGRETVAAWMPSGGVAKQVPYLVFSLATIVGIVTALGVLRLLRPLSRMSSAIARVGAGERGVRVGSTGFVELDELVLRLNEAARAMEDREDAILGRIKAVQEMARMVAHEVRNPLQSLELLTSLIAAEDDGLERHELAKAIHAEIRALDMVVTRVLREGASQASPRITLHRISQKLRPVIDQVLALRRPEAKLHGVIVETGTLADVTADIDAALLGRSIENLVLNAMQAMRSRDGRIQVSVELEPEHFVLLVDDNGPGVDPALGDHVFEPNVTGRTGGTGLGLALVREVIQSHGGTIAHERSPLGGARFVARIPLRFDGGKGPERPDRG